MKIELNNICKISHCEITLDGITVIAGENGTGKSTVGKALYSVFNSFSNVNEQLMKDRKDSLESIFRKFNDSDSLLSRTYLYTSIVNEIIENSKDYINDEELLKHVLLNFFNTVDYVISDEQFDNMIYSILSVLKIEDSLLVLGVLEKRILAEFEGQVSNLYYDESGKISLTIKNTIVDVYIKSNEVINCSDLINLYGTAIYIDDPYILYPYREFRMFYGVDHYSEMRYKLLNNINENNIIDDILTNEKLNSIYSKIEDVCAGNLSFSMHRAYYVLPNSKKLGIQNIATGLTTFVIIKSLLQRGIIKEKGLIILDEPETHLHPKWQLLFAEIIVLLQKEFDLTILLNTHSPYFLEAIEVYSEKYGIKDKCKYYLSEDNEANNSFVINDVTDNTELIYKKLASPFQTLEDERYSSDD